MVDTIVRHDCSNNGLTCGDVKERMMEMKLGLTSKQACNILHRTLKGNHSNQLKKHVVVGQATTSQRNAITVVQQHRWHTTIDTALKCLCEKNTGICKCGCDKSFGELIGEFVVGADETCIMASMVM